MLTATMSWYSPSQRHHNKVWICIMITGLMMLGTLNRNVNNGPYTFSTVHATFINRRHVSYPSFSGSRWRGDGHVRDGAHLATEVQQQPMAVPKYVSSLLSKQPGLSDTDFRRSSFKSKRMTPNSLLCNRHMRKHRLKMTTIDVTDNTNAVCEDPDHNHELDMRNRLGPVGLLTANAVEVGLTTARSYASGGAMGYVFGGVMNMPALFQSSPLNSMGDTMVQGKFGTWNTKAFTQARQFAHMSAAFSGFHVLTKACRGGVEDKWNGIVGGFCTGMYLNRNNGPVAILKGGGTYAGFNYIMHSFMGKI